MKTFVLSFLFSSFFIFSSPVSAIPFQVTQGDPTRSLTSSLPIMNHLWRRLRAFPELNQLDGGPISVSEQTQMKSALENAMGRPLSLRQGTALNQEIATYNSAFDSAQTAGWVNSSLDTLLGNPLVPREWKLSTLFCAGASGGIAILGFHYAFCVDRKFSVYHLGGDESLIFGGSLDGFVVLAVHPVDESILLHFKGITGGATANILMELAEDIKELGRFGAKVGIYRGGQSFTSLPDSFVYVLMLGLKFGYEAELGIDLFKIERLSN